MFPRPKIFKINIIINLTHTNEKPITLEVLELILPEEKVSKEKLDFNVRHRSFIEFSDIESVQHMLENINKIIDIHEKIKTLLLANSISQSTHRMLFPFEKLITR